MRVGLVLGAGGVIGTGWLLGALRALSEETGWDPCGADYVVGTSAGSLVGSLAVAKRPFADAGGDYGVGWPPQEILDISPFRLHRGLPRPGLGSWRLALSTTRRPDRHTPLALYSAWLPNGVFSTAPVRDAIRTGVPDGWRSHPGLWIVACDYDTGRRVAFGREGSPEADLPSAVAASCAIPGSFRSVEIGGRRYVDGGMYSASNLDLLRDQELDLAICLNPTSTLHPPLAWNALERVANTLRSESGKRLGREAKRLRAQGTDVVLVQPEREDLAAMGRNLMSTNRTRHRQVRELAVRTVAEQLRRPENAQALAKLPARSTGRVAEAAGG